MEVSKSYLLTNKKKNCGKNILLLATALRKEEEIGDLTLKKKGSIHLAQRKKTIKQIDGKLVNASILV